MVRVNTCKTVDIEVEVDVDIEEVFAELHERVKVSDGLYWRSVAPVLDDCTKILAMVSDDVIAQLPAFARATMRERLAKELVRYGEEVV